MCEREGERESVYEREWVKGETVFEREGEGKVCV